MATLPIHESVERAIKPGVNMSLKEKPRGAPEHLAEETGLPDSEFKSDVPDESMPKLEELDWEPVDKEESGFSDC